MFAFLRQEYIHHFCKECMGRLLCLFVCYGGQELHCVMDGGENDYIEECLRNGWRKVNIRGSMKEKARGVFLLVCKFFWYL
jgi:hypothetical protein